MDDADWKKRLTTAQYNVLRKKGTEAPFSGQFVDKTDDGTYVCGACGQELFKSQDKYESTEPGLVGWPSFSDVIKKGAVKVVEDKSLGMTRQEVVCSKCGSHLGHVFEANDSPSGTHYCINSVALDFKDKK